MSPRNRNAEHLYGYSSAEAVGQDITRLIVHPDDIPSLNSIIGNIFTGKCWRGSFPVKNKSGERFLCGRRRHSSARRRLQLHGPRLSIRGHTSIKGANRSFNLRRLLRKVIILLHTVLFFFCFYASPSSILLTGRRLDGIQGIFPKKLKKVLWYLVFLIKQKIVFSSSYVIVYSF